MAEAAFQPAWFSKPGDTLATLLDRREMSPEGLAERMGRDPTVVHGLISGNVSIDDALAGLLADTVGGSVTFWKARQSQFDRDLDRVAEAVTPEQRKAWLKVLPIREMMASGWIPASDRSGDTLRSSLAYFDVTDPDEWRDRYQDFQNQFSFRTSPSFESKLGALAAWLRQAEIQARVIACKPWNPTGLREKLDELRRLAMATNLAHFIPRLRAICAEVGVALVFLKAPSGCRASGATRFLSRTKAMIVLSFRYLSDDQFWFSFFHEIGHLLLHGNTSTFVDGEAADKSDREREADAFSAGVLVPSRRQDELMRLRLRPREVIRFAVSLGVSPGIIVGQMQHRRIIGPHQLNYLKRRYGWDEIREAVSPGNA